MFCGHTSAAEIVIADIVCSCYRFHTVQNYQWNIRMLREDSIDLCSAVFGDISSQEQNTVGIRQNFFELVPQSCLPCVDITDRYAVTEVRSPICGAFEYKGGEGRIFCNADQMIHKDHKTDTSAGQGLLHCGRYRFSHSRSRFTNQLSRLLTDTGFISQSKGDGSLGKPQFFGYFL